MGGGFSLGHRRITERKIRALGVRRGKRAPTACQPHRGGKGDHSAHGRLSSCPSGREGWRLRVHNTQVPCCFSRKDETNTCRKITQHISLLIRYWQTERGTHPTSSRRGMAAHSAEIAENFMLASELRSRRLCLYGWLRKMRCEGRHGPK